MHELLIARGTRYESIKFNHSGLNHTSVIDSSSSTPRLLITFVLELLKRRDLHISMIVTQLVNDNQETQLH